MKTAIYHTVHGDHPFIDTLETTEFITAALLARWSTLTSQCAVQ